MTNKKVNLSPNRIIAISALAAVLTLSTTAGQTFAVTNPYMGGYTDTTTNDKPYQIGGKVTFIGSGTRSRNLGNVISTAGWASTDPTPFMYQAPITLQTTNLVIGSPQVWDTSGLRWVMDQGLGYFGTQSYDINWISYYFYWNTARTQVKFYYEVHYNDGSYGTYGPITYSKVSGDSSTSFASGWQDKYFYQIQNYIRIKFLQFGIEGQGGTTSGYNIKMYDMYYIYGSGTTKNLSTIAERTAVGTFDYTYGSYITYDPTLGGCCAYIIGNANFGSDACFYLDTCSLPKGQVLWYWGTAVPAGTKLW